MIIYNGSIFSDNNSSLKVWTLKKHEILYPKGKRKDIMILDFLLL